MSPKLIRTYLRETWKLQRREPGIRKFQELAGLFGRWQESLREGANPLNDQSPWMTFAAIDFLQELLGPSSRVFEYGCGGSSLFFSRQAGEVVSVEHDPTWADRVSQALARERRKNVRLIVALPESLSRASGLDAADPEAYGTSDEALRQASFRAYAASIDAFDSGHFDVTIIDGRARPSCFKHALPKVGVGSWLLLDNAEREHYRFIHQSLANPAWRKLSFSGPGPYNRYFWETCCWQRIQ